MKVEEILKNKSSIELIGKNSRIFAEKNHGYLTIAKRF